MDRSLEPSELRGRRLRRWAVGLALVAGLTAALLLLPGWLRPSVDASTLRTGQVDRGPVEEVIEATGQVTPAFEQILSSPVEARVLRIRQRPGAAVAPGTVIVDLDLAEPRAELGELDDRIARAESERERTRLELADELARLTRGRESSALDAELADARLAQQRKLADSGLAAAEQVHEAEVAARKAELAVAQAAASEENARRTSAAKLRALDLDLSILRRDHAEAERRLELGEVRADRAGVLTFVVQPEGRMVARGDVVARLADLDSFQVEAQVSDVHAARLAEGMPARVLAADASIRGVVERVDPSIEEGTVRFTVALDQPSHPALRDKLRVDVLAVAGRRPQVLRLPRGAYPINGDTAEVFVVGADRLQRRTVQLGLQGRDHLEVRGGLSEGDEVVLSDLSDLQRLEEVKLR